MLATLFGVFEQGLRFAANRNDPDARVLNLLKEVQEIKKDYYAELQRTDYSQLTLDNLMLKLEIAAETFSKLPVKSK